MFIRWYVLMCFVMMAIMPAKSGVMELKQNENVAGYWRDNDIFSDPGFTDDACWIWLPEESEHEVMLFRRSFYLESFPEKAMFRITASDKYQLYVNGEYVCQGPARSAPHHQSYDILDVTKLLKKGENLIAVRVSYQPGERSFYNEGHPGLLGQLTFESNQGRNYLSTNEKWRVLPDYSWGNDSPQINRFQRHVNDRVDMERFVPQWNKTTFDDGNWHSAFVLKRQAGWPAPQNNASGQPLMAPWTSLVARNIPYLDERYVPVNNLLAELEVRDKVTGDLLDGIKAIPIEENRITPGIKADFLNRKEVVISGVRKNYSRVLLFDLGKVYNGMPQFTVKGEEGTVIDVMCAPFVVDETFEYRIVDSEFRDRVTLSGQLDKWESTYLKPVRYLALAVRNTNQPVKIGSVGIHSLSYPFKGKGSMKSDAAPWVEDYMEASGKTIDVCTTDAITDNYREQRQYAQTGYYGALGNYYIYGDYFLQKRYLIQVAQEQLGNGIMPAYAPRAGKDFMVILDSNCLWIRSLYNYFLYSGDEATVRKLLPAAKKLMGLLNGFTCDLGLINDPPYAYWLDHARMDRRGANFTLNGHYLGALEDFSKILEWLEVPEAITYQNRANRLRKALQMRFWDEDQGLFADALVDGELSESFSEHANGMALALNVATGQQADSILEKLLTTGQHNYIFRESGLLMVTPAMSYFFHKGLCEYGHIDESLNIFRSRFDKMLKPETNQTLWEEWWLDAIGRSGRIQKGRTRSDAQTESAFPPALFAEYLLGVMPARPGMAQVDLFCRNNALIDIEGEIPCPGGLLKIKWKQKSTERRVVELDIPEGMTVNVHGETKENRILKVTGNNQVKSDINKNRVILTKGKYQIEFQK